MKQWNFYNELVYNKNNNRSKIILSFNDLYNLKLNTFPSLEAQVASLSDDIAYNNHDIDDGLRAKLFTIEDLIDVPLVGNIVYKVTKLYGKDLEKSRLYNEIVRRTINKMVVDLISETKLRINELKIENVEDIRNSYRMTAGFSEKLSKDNLVLKDFLFNNMYKHPFVNEMTNSAKIISYL